MPKVSVIITAYNQGHFLHAAIESVLAQTHPDFEIIVIDDGSTDNTRAIADSFTDPRLCYVYQENRGLSGARNTGIRHSRGEFLSYLDSDDLFLPRKLEILVGTLEKDSALGFVAGQAIPIDENGNCTGKIFDRPLPQDGKQLLLGNPLHVGGVLVRRAWQEEVGFFDECLRSYEDWDMWLRLVRAGCQMAYVSEPVSLYRFHTEQMTRIGTQMTTATFAVLEKVFGDPTLPEDWRCMQNMAYSHAFLRATAQAYRGDNLALAKDYLSKAVALNQDLLANDGQVLADHMAAWTDLPKISDPLSYLERIYNNLPPGLAIMQRRRRPDLGRAAIQLAFKAYSCGDLAQARTAVRRAFQYQPRWLTNRGALSIFLRSHLPGLLHSSPSPNQSAHV